MNELKKQKNKFFAMVPNFAVDNLSAIALALYITMKRIVGKECSKECYLTNKTYMKRLEIGKDALKKAIKNLIDNNLIYETGKKEIQTSGGPQRVMHYKLNNINNYNIKYYKGRPETTPLLKKGIPKNEIRCAVLGHKEELIIKEEDKPYEELQEKKKKMCSNVRESLPWLNSKPPIESG